MTEIRIDREGDDQTLLSGAPVAGEGLNRTPETDPDHLLPEHSSAVAPGIIAATGDPDTVRSEIERTRARMSSTIDSIEEALLRKKSQLEERLDVTAPVRERVRSNPWGAVAAVFGAGLLLGYITGDSDDDDDRPRRHVRNAALGAGALGYDVELDQGQAAYQADWQQRASQWESRARELMKTCNRQEEEIRHLRGSIGGVEMERGLTWRDSVAESVSGFVGSLFGRGRGEGEYEVQLEEDYVVDLEEGGPYAAYDRDLEYEQDTTYGRQTEYPSSLEDDAPRAAF